MATIQTRPNDKPKSDLLEAIEDTRRYRNLHGPFKTAEEAVSSILEDE
ncbi:MAG: hypothetical protein FWE54_01885 [Methanimicrococcus sp.]|nr:hypothetical protein [Methanimicrococcus sp.]